MNTYAKQKVINTNIKTGIDILEESGFAALQGSKVGLLVNPASVNRKIEHDVDIIRRGKGFELKALFGPQHGIYGHTQDNMIEWTGFEDKRTNLPVYSLYGEVRKPTDRMLEGIDTMLIDLPDIGTRYYTFLWSAKLVMEACAEKGIRVVVLDRPNPIGGEIIEGPTLQLFYRSFVGLSAIPVRHGMTIGELLVFINEKEEIGCKLEIIKTEGWKRNQWADDLDLPWVIPSPNMPTIESATVYPGGCLLEATNISEGRGTCRPFEIMGAPYINAHRITEEMNNHELPGLFLRPMYFQPTFSKHQGSLCGGFQMHITDREAVRSVKAFALFIYLTEKIYPGFFSWKSPPYEYEYDRMPIDILWGSPMLREIVEKQGNLNELFAKMEADEEAFAKEREPFLIYK
ncbi:MAG: DUF1343 domain-containing protein [Firmicutes bacterium]|nr:DUF1343 domain-containing protein [Bacillota bacterium]